MSIEVNIEKTFPGFHLHVTFSHAGGTLGILGGSGMGKSMTLKMIAGLVKPDKGRIVVDDRVVYDSEKKIDLPARERKIGYLFQQYALFPTMTVVENISIATRKKGTEKKVLVNRLMQQFAIEDLGHRMPSELSGGQQQRVALARILASEPAILLLDEPFSALDGYLKEQLLEEMIAQLKNYQGDVVMVSHSRDEIYQCCQELVVIDQGEVKASGETKQVFAQPGCVEAARLTGCKNIIPAKKTGHHTVYVPDWQTEITLASEVADDVKAIGIRAHYIEVMALSEVKEKGNVYCENRMQENRLRVTVDHLSELPFEWYCFFKTESGSRIWWKTAKEDEQGHARQLKINDRKNYILYLPPESLFPLR